VCKSFFAKLFLSEGIFRRIYSFPAPQNAFHNLFFDVILSVLNKLSQFHNKNITEIKKNVVTWTCSRTALSARYNNEMLN